MKLTKILVSLLILTLPLIHGRVLATLGLDFMLVVSGNFEFTKSLYFNIFSSLIFLVFFVEYILIGGNKLLLSLREKNVLIFIYIVLCVSTYFSLSPFLSLIGDLEKGHTFFLISNLLGLYIVMRQILYSQRNFILLMFILSGVLSSIVAIKELYYQSFDYGALGERALGSFGHPNYLSGFLLLLLPFIFSASFPYVKGGIHEGLKLFIIVLFLTTIILCKSLIALFLAILYLLSISSYRKRYITKTYFVIFTILLSSISLVFIGIYFPEKLHSLISRWYLWETTVRIIFSDMKILFLGAGLETLPYHFNSFKVPEIYIFENFGYSADRPHNFFLNVFYHLGLLGVSIFLYLLFLLQRKYLEVKRRGDGFKPGEFIGFFTITLFLLYGIFHYFSIACYVIVVLIIAFSQSPHLGISSPFEEKRAAASFLPQETSERRNAVTILKLKRGRKLYEGVMWLIITIFSLFGAYYSLKLYYSEVLYAQNKYVSAAEIFSHPKYLLKFGETEMAENKEGIISQKNYKTRIILMDDKQLGCDNLLAEYPSAENYFYCGQLLESQGDMMLSKNYYNKGLSKLPDLWNEDSTYWNNYFVKHTITGNRFFSEKFGDIPQVLEKVGKSVEYKYD